MEFAIVCIIVISPFMFIAQSAGAVEYTDHPANKCPGYDTKQSDGQVLCIAGDLGNAEYPFTAIASRSTLARSGSTW